MFCKKDFLVLTSYHFSQKQFGSFFYKNLAAYVSKTTYKSCQVRLIKNNKLFS